MIQRIIFFLLFLFPTLGLAQQNRQVIDSLLLVFKAEKADTSKIKLLTDISEEYSYFSKDSAIIYADKAYTITLNTNDVQQKFQSSNLLSTRYAEKGVNDKALGLALVSLKFAEASGNKKNSITANVLIADLYTNNLKNLPKALEYGNRALSMAKETGDQFSIISNIESLSTTYFNFQKYDEALAYSLEEYKLAVATSDTAVIVRALSNLGDCYRAKRNFAEALNFYNKAIGILRPVNKSPSLFFIYNNVGTIYNDSGNYKKAIQYYLSSIEIAKKFTNTDFLSMQYHSISEAYRKEKNYQKALEYNQFAIKNEERLGKISDLKMLYLSNAAINDSLGNYKAALQAFNRYVAINNDSLRNETYNKVTEMEVVLESEKNQNKIYKINKEKEDQKIIRNSFIAGSILLLLFIAVLINRNKLKRTVAMEKMRSRLSRDLHDDIGSTLSSINILSRTAQTRPGHTMDEKTKTSLQKINERSQHLLDNMSDIIWNINPGNDTIEEVMSRMREYATTVLEAKNIDYVFDFPKQKMDCKLTMEVKNNLYLIFKEAVNNLSKYSGCTKANLSLLMDEKNIHLFIEDNGIGFDNQLLTRRSGLLNMGQRAAEIKGTLTISTAIEKGTLIELSMPRYC